jgi:hypothetical protein
MQERQSRVACNNNFIRCYRNYYGTETAVVDTHVVPGHMPGILLASMTLPELVRAEIAQPVITSAGQEEAVTLLDATESEPELVNTIISQPIITKAR